MALSDNVPVHLHEAGRPRSGAGVQEPLPLGDPSIVVPDLPVAYGDDRVVLLARDPGTLFAYWDLNPATITRVALPLVEARAYLRLIRLGGAEPVLAAEHEIDLSWRVYYLLGCEANRDWRVELVLRGTDGVTHSLGSRSNVATTPPSAPSAWVEDRFASMPLEIPLSRSGQFASGRVQPGSDARMHTRAWELSGGAEIVEETAEIVGSATPLGRPSPRPWSGTLLRVVRTEGGR